MSNFRRSEATFTCLAILFCVNLVLTNILAVKIFDVPYFHVALSGGDLLYPLSFLIMDIITEIWGKQRASFVVYAGFFTCLFMLIVVQICLQLTPHPYWVSPGNTFGFTSPKHYQNAFASVFHVGGFLVLASSVAYLTSQLMDITLFHFFKKLTHGKHLWLRNNGSTILSQMVDSIIFTSIYFFFGIGLELSACVQMFLYMYGFKVFFALIDTPFCYAGIALINHLNDCEASRLFFRESGADQSAYRPFLRRHNP